MLFLLIDSEYTWRKNTRNISVWYRNNTVIYQSVDIISNDGWTTWLDQADAKVFFIRTKCLYVVANTLARQTVTPQIDTVYAHNAHSIPAE